MFNGHIAKKPRTNSVTMLFERSKISLLTRRAAFVCMYVCMFDGTLFDDNLTEKGEIPQPKLNHVKSHV